MESTTSPPPLTLDRVAELFEATRAEVSKVIVGQERLIEGVLVALFAEGSVLLEGAPGLGKTLLVNVLSRTVSCHFRRIQFTPDLMPSDLTGHSVFDMKEQEFHFKPGPIFTNLLLTDEINRSPPKTQSALLEVMQEHQVTVDGEDLSSEAALPRSRDPESARARGHLSPARGPGRSLHVQAARRLPHARGGDRHPRPLRGGAGSPRPRRVRAPAGDAPEDVVAIQHATASVIVEPSVIRYITEIVAKTRSWHSVSVGASPRGSVNLLIASRVLAACRGRDFVIPDDVKEVSPWVLRHRLILRSEAEIEGETADGVVAQILESVQAPRS